MSQCSTETSWTVFCGGFWRGPWQWTSTLAQALVTGRLSRFLVLSELAASYEDYGCFKLIFLPAAALGFLLLERLPVSTVDLAC